MHLKWVWEQQPDVFCLQEIKVRPEQLKEEQRNFPGYDVIWNPAEKLGYSGVATFLRTSLRWNCDLAWMCRSSIWKDASFPRCIPDFRLFNVYFPSGQRGKERVDYKLDFYAHLLSLCDRLHAQGENIIITGDFNTAHMPIDLKNPKAQ